MSAGSRARRRPRLLLVAAPFVVASVLLGAIPLARAQSPTVVRVAYPEEPDGWYPDSSEDAASTDLLALWGLPLFHVDPAGQLRPALAASATVDPGAAGGPWAVEITLREGTWSDGEPVTSADLVATVDALRDGPHGHLLRPLAAVEPEADDRVRFVFDRPYARWASLLSGSFSVLPAHVLGGEGIETYRASPPVAGGPYRLAEHIPGLRAVFEARQGSPLGEAAIDRIEVWFTPSYETALGLLRDQRVDLVAGYLAINPEQRVARVEGALAAAPVGGTWAGLDVEPDGSLASAPRRAAVRDSVSAEELAEGLLREHGTAMTSTVPGTSGGWSRASVRAGLDGASVTLVARGPHEVSGLTARVLQRELQAAEAEVVLVRLQPGDELERRVDATLTVRRDVPWPSSLRLVPGGAPPELLDELLRGDGAGPPGTSAADPAEQALLESAWVRPLYTVAVAHAWRPELEGVRASAYPGVGFWNAPGWAWQDGGPPPQEPTQSR